LPHGVGVIAVVGAVVIGGVGLGATRDLEGGGFRDGGVAEGGDPGSNEVFDATDHFLGSNIDGVDGGGGGSGCNRGRGRGGRRRRRGIRLEIGSMLAVGRSEDTGRRRRRRNGRRSEVRRREGGGEERLTRKRVPLHLLACGVV